MAVGPPSSQPPSAPTLHWEQCRGKQYRKFECARLRVPVDWAAPTGPSMTLAVVRKPASGPRRQRIGSLFLNPGGPGGSGVRAALTFSRSLPAPIRRRFDLVSWDPRGVGRSGQLECDYPTFRLPATGPVDWRSVLAGVRAQQADMNRACADRHAAVLDHLGTAAAVRDLDALRRAVGDRRITYWGISYGTRIGYTYALTFPDRVRAIVLDGNVHPRSSISHFAEGVATAGDSALSLFFQVHQGTRSQYRRANARLSRKPLRLQSGRSFTRWDLRDALWGFSSEERLGEATWFAARSYLARVTDALFAEGSKRRAARRWLQRSVGEPGFGAAGGIEAIVNCADYADRPSAGEQDELARRVRLGAPITGWHPAVLALQCEGLEQLRPDPVPTWFPVNRSARLLLVGSTRDARTPYAWTAAMAAAFPRAKVVTYVGGQHGAFVSAGSRCVDRRVSRYLLRRERPEADVACRHVGKSADRRAKS